MFRSSRVLSRVTNSTLRSQSRNIQYASKRTYYSGQNQSSFNYNNIQLNFENTNSKQSNNYFLWALATGACGTAVLTKNWSAKSEYDQIREEISELLNDENYDDGSFGPIFIRLAWHASGTYNTFDKSGGSEGATIRLNPEKGHGANAGLDVATARLEAIKKKHPQVSIGDIYVLASIVAIEEMGGPKINFKPGRKDSYDEKDCTPDGRLPDAARNADHIRAVFYRMGLNDEEIVALVGGGHAIGRCHTNRSGFTGPWTNSPTVFTNDFFVQLLENKWTEKKWNGPKQYEDPTQQLMMLPTDLELRDDAEFRKYSEKFAKDEEYFFEVFAKAYEKLTTLGCNNLCPYSV